MINIRECFVWRDYCPESMGFVEDWLDADAVKATGLDEGFRHFYEYWAGEDGFAPGENFWCNVVYDHDVPIAVVAFCLHQQKVLIMEIVVAPERRGHGFGTRLLLEFLERDDLPCFPMDKCEAVIFPDNTASRKAFQRAGFRLHHIHEDGTALYYVYERGRGHFTASPGA